MGSYNRMVDTYRGESDRAAAILGSSFVEAMLEDLLKVYLVDDKAVSELFKGDRPLATFSAKINIAFAVGLLPPNVRTDLDKIRKIRNHFAHHPEETNFSASPARDFCGALSVVDASTGLAAASAHTMEPRQQFLLTIAGLSVYFDQLVTALRARRVARVVAQPQSGSSRIRKDLDPI